MNIVTSNEQNRFIDIDGSVNLRDFGGYPTRSGKKVCWGRLFRCGSLNGINELHYDRFADLGIGVICDLRRMDEVAEAPPVQKPPFDCRVHIPIAPGSAMNTAEQVSEDITAQDLVDFMADMSGEIARSHHSDYTQLFEQLMATEDGFLLHCSAGKDRTGFGAALIQAALDVDDELIFQDYMLSNHAIDTGDEARGRLEKIFGFRLDDDQFQALAGVFPEYLNAAYEQVQRMHGSMLGYLDAIGVDEAARLELRRRLVE